MKSASLKTCLLLGLTVAAQAAWAQQGLPGFVSSPGPGGTVNYSVPVQTLLSLTFLGFLPSVLLMMTGFTRIVIVMSLLRMALGTQSSPPNQVIIGLSLFLTAFVMSPVLTKIYDDAYQPYSENKISFQAMVAQAEPPIKAFMLKQTREPDVALFMKLAKQPDVDKPEDLPLKVLVPAFVTSELKTAFQIGFMIFLPFLVIDLIVSSVLMSMGMMMLSPMLISLPFKLMLFVMVDGWTLIVSSLVASFQ
ncbi:MAG: flagellar type III secretion system pore protein FliP [Burkholderiales bacterium]|jgi:flagellar biosynthetic protein FliP|nr:flagellar type III secretion system pore protein FliP [Burkholderiales bacterium]